MNERQRVQYLEAIGIDSFVPRVLLPNAKPSLVYKRSEVISQEAEKVLSQAGKVEEASSLRRADGGAGPGGSPAAASDILNKTLAEARSVREVTEPSPHQVSSVQISAGSAQKELVDDTSPSTGVDCAIAVPAKYTLGLWFTDTGIQVIDAREDNDALPTATLLSNILIATGFLNTNLAPAETQRWPITGGGRADSDWQAASSMLIDFLLARFERNPASACMLFGESSLQAVTADRLNYTDNLFQVVDIEILGLKALVLPSLREFLYAPESKRKLWSAVVKFKAKLR